MVPSTFLRSKPARCLPILLATLIFAGCGTHTQDQSAAFMQGTSQANSSFYLQQMQQSTNDSKTNWQLLAIRALLQEGKKQQAIDLFNQLPANLNSTQAREQSLLAVEVKLAQNDYQPPVICWLRSIRQTLSSLSRRATGRRKSMPARVNHR
ncbi:LppC putative lipoprotein [Klebsiella pneumoniae IS43]|uniref:LppC putative lipoprotein n=1 Tax=Klebsiella pneumoniae IS43 TaxID=1432552 RepID=W1DM49_KLEPN|nr:LppC putative lipoprotein [Klebsiella pneumoniae IS43]